MTNLITYDIYCQLNAIFAEQVNRKGNYEKDRTKTVFLIVLQKKKNKLLKKWPEENEMKVEPEWWLEDDIS